MFIELPASFINLSLHDFVRLKRHSVPSDEVK